MHVSNIKAYCSIFRIRASEMLQYRLAALAGASTSIFYALIDIVVLKVFYTYADNRAYSMNGLSLSQAITYVWIGQALFVLQPSNVDGEILNNIVKGDVGIELCRPLGLYPLWFAKTAAGRLQGLWRMIFVISAGLLVPASLQAGLPASYMGFGLFLCSALSSFLLCASYGMLITALRLGIDWGDGPTYMLTLTASVLSGGFLPLQLWPDFMQRFLFIQPFAGCLDIPVRLYIGTIEPSKALAPILIQFAWILIFIVSGKLLMDKKLKGIVIQGG